MELIPDDGSDKTMEEVEQATTALAPPWRRSRPPFAGGKGITEFRKG